MMSEKQFIRSQKDCADMLGMSLNEYENYCKNVKVVKKRNVKQRKDDAILKSLGLTKNDLKVRRRLFR